MKRSILAVILGYAVWTAIWLGGNLGLQSVMPDQLPQEGVIDSKVALFAVLGLSILCSLVAGLSARAVRRASYRPVTTMALLLLATGIAVQASTWERMPVWYHVTFLALLVPGCFVGARLRRV